MLADLTKGSKFVEGGARRKPDVVGEVDTSILLDKVHAHGGRHRSIVEAVAEVAPVVRKSPSDVVIHASARAEGSIAPPALFVPPRIGIIECHVHDGLPSSKPWNAKEERLLSALRGENSLRTQRTSVRRAKLRKT